MNHKYSNRVKSMKNTRLGKLVCRLMGEEQGAVMMEYVIVAVVIAAACALVMAIWGKAIFGQAKTAIHATEGNPNKAAEVVEESRGINKAGLTEAQQNANKIHGDVSTQSTDN